MLNIIDAIVILVILFGAVMGFKHGFTKQLVSFIGLILIIFLAFKLKNPISKFLYQNLPFFNFSGAFAGVTVLNILVYEIIAFLFVLGILIALLRILLFFTKILESILNFTIVFGVISKILGAIVGAVQYYVIAFIILYILSLPFINLDIVNESKLKDPILDGTPILSKYMDKTLEVFDELGKLKEKHKNNANAFNLEALDILLKYKIIDVNSVEELIKKGKLSVAAYNVLDKYR